MTTWNKLNWTLQLGVHKQDHWRKKGRSQIKINYSRKINAQIIRHISWKKENSDAKKFRKKIRAPCENEIHDPLSSSLDALTTEQLEALWRAGSKLN